MSVLAWLLLGLGVALLIGAVRFPARGHRAITQGVAVLLVAIGGLMLLRRPGSAFHLPGHGPRRWHQP